MFTHTADAFHLLRCAGSCRRLEHAGSSDGPHRAQDDCWAGGGEDFRGVNASLQMDIIEQTVAKADSTCALKSPPSKRGVRCARRQFALGCALCISLSQIGPGTPAFKDDYWKTAPTCEPIDFKVKTSSRVPLPLRAIVAPALRGLSQTSCSRDPHGGSPPPTRSR